MKHYVGHRHLKIVDKERSISSPLLVMYPSYEPAKPVIIGPYTVESTLDAKIIKERLPVVIISHGTGGTHLGYLTIAEYLAENGYIVAMPEHYGNNTHNNTLEGALENLQMRPKHISLALNSVYADSVFAANVTDKVALIGHSMGGYTVLAAAGGQPWTESHEKVIVQHDKRIDALVLLAPATEWFTPEGTLNNVNLPILMLTAEHDFPLENGWHKRTADLVINRIIDKEKVISKVVDNAGHFSFLSPFPKSMSSPHFLPSTDQVGFNRVDFHKQLNKEIKAFLNENI
ncbi:alpha/beta hydrolase family protein [Psychromonas sp. B3M02]|uniref:alpha/beta hydrolase family protein n=1 Tax=Psychromonas sp. B3M02 TaxID=2267226 RepID=UPI001C68A1B2|nr:alpha/beta fold hydrolase [Psychromonas sp. B3M02]